MPKVVTFEYPTTHTVRWVVTDAEEGIVFRHGIDDGPKPDRIVFQRPNFIVVKIPGHKYWGGIGMDQNYAPASFQVYGVLDRGVLPDGRPYIDAVALVDLPVKKMAEGYNPFDHINLERNA